MSLSALLDGPRGRRLLLELAVDSSRAAHGGGYPDWPAGDLLWKLQHELDPNRDRFVFFGPMTPESTDASDGPDSAEERAPDEPATPESLAGALLRDSAAVLTGDAVREALVESVDSARYWQEPDGRDVLAALPAMRGVLAAVLAELEMSGLGSWWSSPIDLEAQFDVAWSDMPSGQAAGAGAGAVTLAIAHWSERATQLEQRAARDWPTDPTKGMGSDWWSTPGFGVVKTSRWVPAWQSPAALWLVEDSLGWTEARVAAAAPIGDPRVFEITGAAAWAELCTRYPIEVTAQKRRDWYVTTGRTGVWIMPDWTAVSRDYDAVHLTVLGYLSAAGRAIPVGHDSAGLIAGWAPDEAVWLTDSVAVDETVASWVRTDAHGWRPTAD
jgi:hypothetical protein